MTKEKLIEAVCAVFELQREQLKKRKGRIADKDEEERVSWARGICAILAKKNGIAVMEMGRTIGFESSHLSGLQRRQEGWLRQSKWVDPPARALRFAEKLRAVKKLLKESRT